MAESNVHYEDESKESASLQCLSPSEILRCEKGRLEESPSEVSRALSEIEFHERVSKMEEKALSK